MSKPFRPKKPPSINLSPVYPAAQMKQTTITDIHSIEFLDALREFCLQYLDSLSSTLWSRSWNIHEKKDRIQAADWLAATMIEVISISTGE